MHKRREGHQLSVVLIKFKIEAKGWDSDPYLLLQNPVVLPSVPWEQLEILTNVSEIIKIYGLPEIRSWTYCLRNVCPHRTAETIYLKIKIVGKNTLIKKKCDFTILNE